MPHRIFQEVEDDWDGDRSERSLSIAREQLDQVCDAEAQCCQGALGAVGH